MAYVPNSGSVVAFQSDPTKLVGTVSVIGAIGITGNPSISGTIHVDNFSSVTSYQLAGSVLAVSGSFSPTGNQSVSGTVGASIIGQVTVVSSLAGGIFPVSGSVAAVVTNFPTTQNVSGSVAAWLQSTNASVITKLQDSSIIALQLAGSILATSATVNPAANQSVSGTVQADIGGSVATVIIGGSIATATTNSSVMLLGGTNVIGSVATLQGTNPWTVVSSISGGIFPVSGSVAATITNTTVPISGSVATFQAGTVRSSISGNVTVVSSIAGGIFPVSGSVAAVITNTNLNVSGSVAGWLQSTNASVITILQASSIAGTYAEDTAHANNSRGLFILGVRNDTLASVTSADGDLSAFITGPTGEMIVANAPITRWVQGTNSVMYGASVAVLAAQGSSIFTYVTGVQITNDSANYSRVTFQGASSSVIGYVPAPANSGAVFTLPNAWKSNANGAITASITGVSSVYVSLQGFISKV